MCVGRTGEVASIVNDKEMLVTFVTLDDQTTATYTHTHIYIYILEMQKIYNFFLGGYKKKRKGKFEKIIINLYLRELLTQKYKIEHLYIIDNKLLKFCMPQS